MSPEQAEGKPVDERSDIFSLGVMLHEMAVGERPFKGDTNVSIISSILKDTPDSVTNLNPGLPPGLARIIRRSLAKDPSRRYQSALDLRNELEELKQDLDSAATLSSASLQAPVRRGARRVRTVPLMLGAAVLLVILVIAGVLALRGRGGPAAGPGEFDVAGVTRLTTSGAAQQAVISADGRYVVHIKMEAGRPSLWVRQTATTGDVQIAPPSDVRYAGLAFSPDGNYIYYATYPEATGLATLYKLPVLGGSPQRVLEDVDSPVSFSPDGSQMAFMRGMPSEGRTYLMIAAVDGSNARRVATVEPPDYFLRDAAAWSPDGQTILALVQSLRDGPHSRVVAVAVASGKAAAVGGKWAQLTDVDWMPDGRSYLVTGADLSPGTFQFQLWQVPYPEGERHRLTVDLNNYFGVSLSADGKSLATVQSETESALWIAAATDLSGGSRIATGRGSNLGQAGVAWTPDGRILYSSAATGSAQIWLADADGSHARQVTTARYAAVQPGVTPDGRYLVYQQIMPSGIEVARTGLDGSATTVLASGGAFNPKVGDNRWVYYNEVTTGSPRAFRVAIDGGTPAPVSSEYFSPLDVSSDGSRLLGVSWNPQKRRSVYAVMPAEGGAIRELDLPVLGPATFTRDGRSVTYLAAASGGKPGLWRKRLDGGTPERLTDVPETVLNWAWSFDGTRLLLVRGDTSSDVVIATRAAGRKP